MKPLKTRKGYLWGREYDVTPYLIDAIHGDGKQLMRFQYMDDRPFYYVARIDSSVNLDDVNDDILSHVTDSIVDEAIYKYLNDEQLEEYEEKGYITSDRPWPVPPMEMPSGTIWGEYTGSLELEGEVKS